MLDQPGRLGEAVLLTGVDSVWAYGVWSSSGKGLIMARMMRWVGLGAGVALGADSRNGSNPDGMQVAYVLDN